MTFLQAALKYASDLNWPVFPVHSIVNGACTCCKGRGCEHPGKHPRTMRGWKDASTDLAQLQAWGAFALLLESFGRLEESESAFRTAIRFNPNPVDYRNLALILRKLGRGKEAEPMLLKSVELDPTYPLSYDSLGHLYMQELGRLDEAERMFRKAIELEPESASFYAGLAELGFRRATPRRPRPCCAWRLNSTPRTPATTIISHCS